MFFHSQLEMWLLLLMCERPLHLAIFPTSVSFRARRGHFLCTCLWIWFECFAHSKTLTTIISDCFLSLSLSLHCLVVFFCLASNLLVLLLLLVFAPITARLRLCPLDRLKWKLEKELKQISKSKDSWLLCFVVLGYWLLLLLLTRSHFSLIRYLLRFLWRQF